MFSQFLNLIMTVVLGALILWGILALLSYSFKSLRPLLTLYSKLIWATPTALGRYLYEKPELEREGIGHIIEIAPTREDT